MNLYRKIFSAFNKGKIDYIVVGGVAMNLLGYTRFTGDIDILIALDDENIAKVAALMKRLGYEKRLPIEIEELGDEKRAVELIRKKHLIAFTYINRKEPQYNIDVIVGPSLAFGRYRKHRQMIDAWNLKIPVISIGDLIELKHNSDRKKDIEDVEILLQLKGL